MSLFSLRQSLVAEGASEGVSEGWGRCTYGASHTGNHGGAVGAGGARGRSVGGPSARLATRPPTEPWYACSIPTLSPEALAFLQSSLLDYFSREYVSGPSENGVACTSTFHPSD